GCNSNHKQQLNQVNWIVPRNEQKLHHLEEALPEGSLATATAAVRNAYTRRVAEQQEVACLMLVSMTPEIQKNLEDRTAFEILQELKTMFQQQDEQELFKTVKAFHAFKQDEGQSVSTYVLKMKAYLDQMERLGYLMTSNNVYFIASFILLITEYLVNISKRRAFWSLNEDILKITVLTTNTPYPSRKIRRICACTHQSPRRKHDQYAISREDQYAVLKI
ncbi:hypothetical protein Tco_1071963, partial [Tanacetum coccineum]